MRAEPIGRIVAPLVSPNEPESQVVEIAIEPYAKVSRGDVVCVLETTKSAIEVESEHEGYTGPIAVSVNDRVSAGQLICEVFASVPERGSAEAAAGAIPAGLKLTRNAERLAREAGIDLSLLPTDRFVTERDVEALIPAAGTSAELDASIAAAIHDQALVVFGAGGHAASLIDLIRSSTGYEAICVVDDDPDAPPDVLGVPVLGAGVLAALREHGLRYAVNSVGAIGRMRTRMDVGRRLDEVGFELPALVDRAAFVAGSAQLASGVQVFAGAAVCSTAAIGASAIVNTGAIASHGCRIGAFAHLAPGAILAGEVEVGDGALVGMGVTVNIRVRIGAGAIVGNGAVVNESVPDGAIVPAGTVWPK